MPSKGFLRTLIVAEIGLGIFGGILSLLAESSLPEPLRAFLEAESERAVTTREVVMLAAVVPLLVLFLVSSIGLFFFWRPARLLYVITLATGFLLTPLMGPYVDAGWGTAFEEVGIFVSGMIVALIYFSPLKDWYDRPKTPPLS